MIDKLVRAVMYLLSENGSAPALAIQQEIAQLQRDSVELNTQTSTETFNPGVTRE